MPALSIFCFGDFEVRLDGESVRNFDTDKTRALLAYLAVERHRAHTRAHLAGLLWSDQPEERALHSLRQTLSYLRKALHETPNVAVFLLVERDSIRLNPAAQVWVDVQAFNQGLDAAYRHYHNRDGFGRLNPQRLCEALDLYRGLFLDQVILEGSPLFDEWSSLLREQLNRRCVEGLALLAEFYERRCEYGLARQTMDRILRLTPWDEAAHSQMIRLLAVDGQWSAAQNQYVLMRRCLREYFGLEPSEQTAVLFEAIRSQSPVFPRFGPVRHNLPDAGLPFVGRSAELTELMDSIIDPECRMLTLLGPGGVGKTRLALEAARRQVGVFPDGVFLAALRGVNTAEQLSIVLADALGCNFSDQRSPSAQLSDFLRRKNLLMVLDNFEQLLTDPDSVSLLAELLVEAPAVMFLVTSRERLNLREECIFAVDGLTCPDGAGIKEPLETYEALTLFLRRARQVKRDFQLDAENLTAAAQICRLVGGLPLGIELAAAMLWSRTCTELAAAVQANLDTLEGNAANAPIYHGSLRRVFAVSWQLLNPIEQQAFARLSIFRGGFTLDAAIQVTGVNIETLDALVGQSLLRRANDGRYDLHETLRQYAAEKLDGIPGELQALHRQHATYYVDLLSKMEGSTKGSGQIEALTLLQLELENAQVAWNWLISNDCAAQLAACVESLYQFFNIRGRFIEGIAWFQLAIVALEALPYEHLALAMMLSRQGALAYRIRQMDIAGAALERSREILIELGQHSELAFCLISLGGVQFRRKDFATALTSSQQSLEIYRQTGNLSGQAYALYLQGLILNRLCDFYRSKPLFEESVQVARRADDPRRTIAPLNLLGDIACFQGDYVAAERFFEDGINVSRQLNDRFNLGILINNLATVFQMTQRYAQAQSAYEESLSICREQGDRDGEAMALNNLGELAVARGEFKHAISISGQALVIAEEMGEDRTIAICLNNLGEATCAMGDYEQARAYFQRGIGIAVGIQATDLTARLTINMAPVFQQRGERKIAIELLRAALAHSATEQTEREKAIRRLTEMGTRPEMITDDSLLEEVVRRHMR
jgi:predicted ATPase/DNA-binding SARP family transcriptional activator/Tfp pilus assembly protein PilF